MQTHTLCNISQFDTIYYVIEYMKTYFYIQAKKPQQNTSKLNSAIHKMTYRHHDQVGFNSGQHVGFTSENDSA